MNKKLHKSKEILKKATESLPEKPKRKKPKGSGRRKGVPNRNSTAVRDALDSQDFDLIKEILKQINALDYPKDKLVIMMELLKYVYPKRKEVETDPALLKVVPQGSIIDQTPVSKMSNLDLLRALKKEEKEK